MRVTAEVAVPVGDVDLGATLAGLAWLAGDPTLRCVPGRFERATVTPEGTAAVEVAWRDGAAEARVRAHGPGADRLLDGAPGLLGLEDDVTGFDPADPPLRDLWRRHRRERIPRTGTVWHDVAWLVVQQRVTRQDAAAQWRRLVTGLGAPVPGLPSVTAPPTPDRVARLDPAGLHRWGIERRRGEALIGAARACLRLHAQDDADPATVLAVLGGVRGIGPWTTASLATCTWGDADAVPPGDAGLPARVAWTLAREERADDARMLELLEPHRPHRQRVVRLALHAPPPPRRAPRGRRHDIRPR
ncbi:DNA-3-methyladenine glycosylase family protein [Geodermatophilus marinus]|uniref:DNA-3-methyladenine glycosylase family protein n=1 Tax=Geodermatophilus sp. LHW52908 TaxID=2303986 RepID=UPI000E3E6F08|nr:DNA-3-methyladenine glycosylase 2 family protein [Geodermatophilus sp. LHW52908]RFU21059.1 DNA-3-methyladenine glycosylase 2 family protein [Geodermatophilus sp. LHW52908]